MFANASAIIIHDNKVLIIQRSLDNEYFPGVWAVPGGGMEKVDRSIEDIAKRETLEEMGIEIVIDELVQNHYNPESDVLFFKLSAHLANPEDFNRDLDFSDEVNDYKWVTKQELDNYEFTPYTVEEIKSLLS